MSTRSSALTPLMRASAIGHEAIVKDLLVDGVDVNVKGPRGSTALMFAASSGSLEIVQALVENGAEIDVAEEGGWTARRHAEEAGFEDVAKFLSRAERYSAALTSLL